MKKFFAIITMGFALAACTAIEQAEPIEEPAGPKTYTLTINATKGDDAATKALDIEHSGEKNILNATWGADDEVSVYNFTTSTLLTGTLKAETPGSTDAKLSGSLTGTITEGDVLYLLFPNKIASYIGQDGTLPKIATDYDYCYGQAKVTKVVGSDITVVDNVAGSSPVIFSNCQAIVKFTLLNKANNAPINATSLTISATQSGDPTVNTLITSLDLTAAAPAPVTGSLTITPAATNEIFAALSGITGSNVTLTANDGRNIYTFEKANVTFNNGKYYEIIVKMKPEGAICGLFTVDGKQVYFSPGNLQATTSDRGAHWTWAFAANQWDKIGGKDQSGSGTPTGNNYINGNGTLSENGTFTVDLFGWSTSATHLGINNSTDNTTYSGDFADWGSASEVTSCIGTGWRTLTLRDWQILLNERSTKSGSDNAAMRYVKAGVNGVYGLIVFPDDWEDSYHPLTASYINNNAIDFTNVTISSSVWASDFEAHGAVFLPVAGQRHVNNNYVEYPNGRGHYWSSTPNDSGTAYRLYFTGSSKEWSYGVGSSRRFGYSVRLVRNAN